MNEMLSIPEHRTRIIFLSLFILAIGIALRVYDVGKQPLWTDEANCLAIAQGASGSVWEALQKDCSPPLYYWLLGLAISSMKSPSETEIRILSVVFGILAIPLLMWVGYQFLGMMGLMGGVLIAVSPLHIWHSQEARMYSLIVLLGAFLIYFMLRILENRESRFSYTGLVLVQLILLWTHHFSIFPVLLSWIMIYVGTGRSFRTLRPYILILFAGWLPIGWLEAVQSFAYRTGDWLPPPPADAIFRSVGLWVCGIEALDHTIIARIPITVVFGALGIALPALYGFRIRVGRWCALFVAGGLLLSFTVSLIRPAYTPGRYDVCFLPAFLIYLSAGLKRSPRMIRIIALTSLLIAGFLGIRHYFTRYEKSAIRSIVSVIDAMAHEDDAIVIVPEIEVPVVRYYYSGSCEIIVPPSFSNVRTVDYRDYKRRWSSPSNSRILAHRTRSLVIPDGRIFLIYSPYKGTVEYKGWLQSTADSVERLMRTVTGSGYTELILIGS